MAPEYVGRKYHEFEETSRPIAKEIVKMLIDKEISYLECYEALEIAKEELNLTRPLR